MNVCVWMEQATNFMYCIASRVVVIVSSIFLFIIPTNNNNLHYYGRIMRTCIQYIGTGPVHSSHGYNNNNNKGNGKNLLAVINGLFGYFSTDWRHRLQQA